ncbi:MAG TPA: M56 family metallopeptidase [Phycisphaerae bacterium]|nr:M56 family metallopeptidase [Phycisphaerae bacterium]
MAIDFIQVRALAEIAVKSTCLLAAAGMATVLLRRATAASRHACWTSAMAGLLLLPAMMVVLPAVRIVPVRHDARPQAAAPQPADVLHPSPLNPTPEAATGAPAAPSLVNPPPAANGALPSFVPVKASIDWLLILACVYAAGVILFSVPLLMAPWRVRRALRRLPACELEEGPVARAHQALGMARRVRVVVSDAWKMPVAVGLLRPAIVLPLGAADWPEEQLHAVLLHELAHARRRDLPTQALALLARAVYWPHPLAWVAVRQMEIEREKACDDLVIGRGVDAPGYAHTLLEMALTYQRRPLMRYSAVSMARPSSLESRIRAVLRPQGRRGAIGRSALVALAVATLGVTAGLATLTAAPPASSDQPAPRAAAKKEAGNPAAGAVSEAALPAGWVSIIAVGANAGGPFWTVDGQPTLLPGSIYPGPTDDAGRLCILKVHQESPDVSFPVVELRQGSAVRDASDLRLLSRVAENSTMPAGPMDAYYEFKYPAAGNTAVLVGIARSAWKTFAEGDHAQSGKTDTGTYVIGDPVVYEPAPPLEGSGGGGGRRMGGAGMAVEPHIEIRMAYTMANADMRVVAVFVDGSEHPMTTGATGRQGSLWQVSAYLEGATRKEIKTFRFQSRPIEWTTFDHIATEPAADGAAGAAARANEQPAATQLEAARARDQLEKLQRELEALKGRADDVSAAKMSMLAEQAAQLRALSSHLAAATQPADVENLSTQDLAAGIRKLQEQMETLATVPHGPYIAGPNGPEEPPGYKAHVAQMHAEIARMEAELAKRAGE